MAFRLTLDQAALDRFTVEAKDRMARAATGAITEAGAIIKRQARANIAGAGFSTRWQNALRVDIFPAGGRPSINAAAFVHHNIPYAGVFEDGATIGGNPYLWLPIDKNLPLRPGGARWTPELLARSVGDLVSINRPGQPPLLAAKVAVGQSGGVLALPSLANRASARLARAIYAKARTVLLPVFVGVSQVEIGKKFNLRPIVQQVAAQLPALFEEHLGAT